MKHLFIAFLFSVFSINCFGQDLSKFAPMSEAANSTWVYSIEEADELRGLEKRTLLMYVTDNLEYSFGFIISDNEKEIIISSRKGVFDYKIDRVGNDKYVNGKCGFYDKNDQLILTLTSPYMRDGIFGFSVVGNGYDGLVVRNYNFTKSQKEKRQEIINKIFDYIMNEDGYVRFIAPKYSGPDMDIIIPCVNSNYNE